MGVRLGALLDCGAPARDVVVVTDVRGHWAAPWIMAVVRAGVMEPYPNHTFGPRDRRRGASTWRRSASRVLDLIGARRPRLARDWQAVRPRIADLSPDHLGYPAAALVVGAGVMPLVDGGAFEPTRPVSGGEAIDVVTRLEVLAPMTKWTVANQLTLLRMLLIPAFVILVVYGQARLGARHVRASPASPTASTASSRRRAGQKTSLGAWLDPMADKLLLVTTFVVLTVPGTDLVNRFPFWLTILVITQRRRHRDDRGDRDRGDGRPDLPPVDLRKGGDRRLPCDAAWS